MRLKKLSIKVCVLALMLLSFGSTQLFGKKILRFQLVYPKTSMVAVNSIFFAEKVNEYTHGKVKVKIFYPGQLVKAAEGLTALQRGMIDGYIGSMLYFAGTVPEVNGEWLPFCWDGVADVLDVYYNYGFLEVLREALKKHDVYYLSPIMVSTMGFMTKFPIRTLKDLKGRTIRAVGMEAKIVKALGATSVAIAGAEQYTALQRGVVDGTDYPWYTLEDYKFYEVVKYVSEPALHTPGIVEILISNRAMKKLNSDERKAIERAGLDTAIHSARLSEDNDKRARRFGKAHGIEFIKLSEDVLSRFRKATSKLYKSHMKQCSLCAKQVKILARFYKEKNPHHPAVEAVK